MIRSSLISRLVLGTCLFALGCGSAATEGRKDVYPVSGKITMSGGPLVGASVSFAPLDGQPVATGRTNNEGEYTLTTYEASDGAAEGQFAVVVTKSTAAPAASGGDEHSADPYAEIDTSHNARSSGDQTSGVPVQYTNFKTTPLQATVTTDGENRFEFEL